MRPSSSNSPVSIMRVYRSAPQKHSPPSLTMEPLVVWTAAMAKEVDGELVDDGGESVAASFVRWV